MIVRTVLPALAMLMSVAHAGGRLGEPPSAVADSPHQIPMQLAINLPVGWFSGASAAGSAYVGISSHVAARVNLATYKGFGPAIADVLGAAGGGDGDEASHSGRVIDVSAGVVIYPRALWSGPTLEVAGLRRGRSTGYVDEAASPAMLTTNTTTYGGRVLVGWSWLINGWGVISWAAGASMGYERGTETSNDALDSMPPQTRDVAREKTSFEGYLRFGAAFDM